MRSNEFYGDAAVFVENGNFKCIWARSHEEIIPYADVIHEAMINITKKESEYNDGTWLWVFCENFKCIEGRKL